MKCKKNKDFQVICSDICANRVEQLFRYIMQFLQKSLVHYYGYLTIH